MAPDKVHEFTLVRPAWPCSENQAKVRKEKGPAYSISARDAV